MKFAHHQELDWTQWPEIRGDAAYVKLLLQGTSGEVDDYEFMLSRIKGDGQVSPRHRHVFDQFRCAIDGDIPLNPGQVIPKGSIAFIPEGVSYGPFSLPKGLQLLSLQFGGPSGLGHVHTQDLLSSYAALEREGSFEKGVYTWVDADGGKHNKDAHKAVWERITGRDVNFPTPRFAGPAIINPDNFQWIRTAPMVEEKLLGIFNERGTSLRMLRLEAQGSVVREAGRQPHICFVLDGACNVGDETACQAWDSFRLEPGESTRLSALSRVTILDFGLPSFE